MSHLKLPTIVFACKSDLDCHVDPKLAISILDRYDTGLIEVNTTTSSGKERIRMSFDWIFKAIFNNKRESFFLLLHRMRHMKFNSAWRSPRPGVVPESCLPSCTNRSLGCFACIIRDTDRVVNGNRQLTSGLTKSNTLPAATGSCRGFAQDAANATITYSHTIDERSALGKGEAR